MSLLISAFLVMPAPSFANAGADLLVRKTITFRSEDPTKAFLTSMENLREIFDLFQPGLDSSITLVKGPTITGTSSLPHLRMTLQKCVLIVCESVELSADISFRLVDGQCQHNLEVVADLRGSGKTLTNVYNRLTVPLCFTETSDNNSLKMGTIKAEAWAHKSPTYSKGMIQEIIMGVVQKQVDPILKATMKVIKKNGAQ